MSNVPSVAYNEKDWQDAYQAAEENGFDEVDAREQGGGELGAVVAGFYAHGKVGQDEEVLWAAVKLAGQVWDLWDAEQFNMLLNSFQDMAEEHLETLVKQHLDEVYDGFPIEHVKDVEKFFKECVLRETEAYIYENGRVFVFDKTMWA